MQTKQLLAALLAVAVVACSKTGNSTDAEAPAADAPSSAPVAGAAASQAAAASAPAQAAAGFQVEDIDRWQRGMAAEKKALHEAAARHAGADEQARRQAALEMNTVDSGAAAAGVDRDRYRLLRSTFSSAVSQLSPIEAEMDVSTMPPQMVEQMKASRAAAVAELGKELPAEVLAALKTRAADLRQQDKELATERLKLAGAAR